MDFDKRYQGSEAFWQSIIPDKSIRERTLNMWKLAGMDSDARRFAKGKQILIATERALSDALHRHSAEMRDVYPLCGRAGISTQEADNFMRPAGRGGVPCETGCSKQGAMLYLCHDFYKGLANVYINTAMLARFGAPAARRLWDTIKSEGLKKDGVGKIQSRLETETERLNREVKEAIASPHASHPLRCNVPLCNSVAKQVACACGISASLPQGTAKVTEKRLDGNYKVKDGYLNVDEGILMLERIAGAPMVWESLISDAGKRKKVLELRKELKQPIEFRQMDKKVPVPLEPELYTQTKAIEAQQSVKTQEAGGQNMLISDTLLFSQDISVLKEPFRKKLHEAASLFYWATVKDTGNEWAPIPLSPVEVRDNQKQAKVMVELYPSNRLADIYAKNGDIPASRRIYELLDHIFVDGLPYFLEEYRKFYTPILPESFVKTKDLDAGEKHWKVYFENLIYGYTDDSVIAGYFMNILQKMFMDSHTLIKAAFNRAFKIPTVLPWEKESNKTQQKELAKKILVHMLEDPQKRYGYMSTHRFGHAVDVHSGYKYLEKLKKHIKDGNFGLSCDDNYHKIPDPVTGIAKPGHLHIGLKN